MEGLEGIGTAITDMKAAIAELSDQVTAKEPDEVKTKEEVADLEQAAIAKSVTDMEVWGIPLGKAALGGLGAVVGSELVDGFMVSQSNTTKGFVKLIAAGSVYKFGKRWLGAGLASAITLVLAYDGIRSLLPIDEWGNRIASTLTGIMPGAGLAGKAGMGNQGGGGVPATVGSSYAGIFNRAG